MADHIHRNAQASELRGLRWSDVDLDKKLVHVRQRVDRWNNAGMPKSKAGQRTILMTPFLVNTLREWKLACPSSELVFPSANGTPLMHSNICNLSFYPLQVRAGLVDEDGEAKYNLYALRHFSASHWIDLGFAPKRIRSWMGHASITMTFDVYGHLMPSDEDDHAKLAAGELSIVG